MSYKQTHCVDIFGLTTPRVQSYRLESQLSGISTQVDDLGRRSRQKEACRFDHARLDFDQYLLTRVAELRSRILAWLSQLQPNKKHSNISDKRMEDTGNWLFKHDQYQEWKVAKAKSGALWCFGDPGTGKT